MKKKIAVFSTSWSTDILYRYLAGVREGFQESQADIYLFLCNAALDDGEDYVHGELNIFDLPDLSDFDAALIFANSLDFPGVIQKLDERCAKAGIPVVYTGKKMKERFFVGTENCIGTRQLCEHLMDVHGVKNIWFIAGSEDNMDSNQRLETFRTVLRERGYDLKDEDYVYTGWIPMTGIEYLWKRLEKGDSLPDAIICANDSLAIVFASELAKLGVNIPDDVIVTGFDNEYSSQVFWPSICSVDQRFDLIGKSAAELILRYLDGKPCPMDTLIPCEAIPGESCGCLKARDSDSLRRELGRRYYANRVEDTFFDRNLSLFEHSIMDAKCFEELGKQFQEMYADVTLFEGDAFHILLDPLFEASIYEKEKKLRRDGYSSKMDVLFSIDHGTVKSFAGFDTKDLVPQIKDKDKNKDKNNLFLFMPLQEEGFSIGYIIFCDNLEKLQEINRLRRYVERVDMMLGKYLRDRRVEVLHSRLLDMTRTDALTHVKNRTAYEERERILQGKINANEDFQFGLAIFDLNNLKLFNDQLGHEAGDAYILSSCALICKVFKRSAVYRIGGDEFVAVLEGQDYDDREFLLTELTREMERLRGEDLLPQDKVSVAAGLATFDREKDTLVTDVFSRADGRMYENKITMKKQGW